MCEKFDDYCYDVTTPLGDYLHRRQLLETEFYVLSTLEKLSKIIRLATSDQLDTSMFPSIMYI